LAGKTNATNPTEALEALGDGSDMIKVDSIVSEFLSAQSLKVLPQGPFGDAVNQFVSKDDKHAMELFVSEHLSGQVQQMLGLESDDEDFSSAMEIYRARIEQQVASGATARSAMRGAERKRVLRPKPDTWDSDFDGRWEDEPDAWVYEDVTQPSMAPTTQNTSRQSRGKTQKRSVEDDEDEDLLEDAQPPAKTTSRGGRTTAASRATKAAPKKAAAATKKPPARGKGRKVAVPSEDEEEEEDVVMESDEEEAPPPPPATKAKATRQPAKKAAAAPKASSTRAASGRTRQTQLDFSQSQPRTTRGAAAGSSQKKALEISDDEISDEDDAFEPAPVASRTRRR
jgi:double-strand break repair protein MRE11